MTPQVLSLELTERCNISCAHCLVGAQRGRGPTMTPAIAAAAVRVAADLGIPLVSATGGEPTLAPEALRAVLDEARDHGIWTRMVSNGSWARSRRRAYDVVRELHDRGLTQLVVSADTYHQEHVPLDAVRSAVVASQEADLPVEVNVVISRDDTTLDILREVSGWNASVAVTPLTKLGRAREIDSSLFFEPSMLLGCPVVESPLVDVHGTLKMCCNLSGRLWREAGLCPPYILGDLTNGLDQGHRDAWIDLSHKIGTWGPIAIAKALDDDSEVTADQFSSPCEACMHLATSPQLIDQALNTPDHDIEAQIPWQDALGSPVRAGSYKIHETMEVLSFEMSTHLASAETGRQGYIASYSPNNGSREFVLLDESSYEELSQWLERSGPGGLVEIAFDVESSGLADQVRRQRFYSELVDGGGLSQVSSETIVELNCLLK